MNLVEKESFCELMEANNKYYKPVSSKKIRSIIINLDGAIRSATVEAMKGLSVCFTLDHWTSQVNQNYTGITAPSEEKEESEDEDDMFAAAAAAASYGGNNTSPGVLSVDNACSADELNCYMAAPMLSICAKVDGSYVWHDPLAWWKNNQVAYPILARLAMVYLAVQATFAPSERVVSMASRIITNRRNRLDPTMAGKMLFASENWKWWQDQLDFHKTTEDDDEVQVMEE
jgi:hAT family C-terminal dimerisation region